MVYAGAVAGGAFASAHVVLFGHRIDTPAWAYVTMAVTGVLANTIGAVDRLADRRLRRPAAARALRQVAARHARASRPRGALVRPLRRARSAARPDTPVVRSFVAIPAGIARMPLARFVPLALIGCIPFCFGLAGGGWALGSSYGRLHHDFNYVSIAIGVLVVAANRLPDPAQAVLYTGNAPMIPLVDVKAQYAPLIPELKERSRRGDRLGPLHPRAERRRLRGGGRRLPRRARDDRRRERHRRARARPRRDGDRPRRRGDLPLVHVLRDVRGDRASAARRPCSPTSTRRR